MNHHCTRTTPKSWFPHGMENLENWENIFKSGNFTQKYWKSEGIAGKRGNFTQNTGKGGNFSQFFIFLWFVIEVYWLNRFLYLLNSWNKTLKKILEKSGNLSVRKCGNHGYFKMNNLYGIKYSFWSYNWILCRTFWGEFKTVHHCTRSTRRCTSAS